MKPWCFLEQLTRGHPRGISGRCRLAVFTQRFWVLSVDPSVPPLPLTLGSFHVPDSYGSRLGTSDDLILRHVELDTLHWTLVAGQTLRGNQHGSVRHSLL